ncbi:LacI family DNA-binding transcriptional regulator [Kribbella sp. NPDC050124]|uniref:LacI family DNA-binding transcriptional regulator n=1 Tax=Kribbella sp. NPDC050124 TaxID=3364114 RepID=UPI00378B76E7
MAAEQQRRKSATRSDVARLAGVAPTTVSAILNGRAAELKLAEATVRRVEEAARELRYLPNAAARALRRQGSRTLGLMWGPGYRDTITAAAVHAHELGYFTVLLSAAGDARDAIMAVRDAGIAGLMCPAGGQQQAFGEELHAAGVPVVWMDPYYTEDHGLPGPLIAIDARIGAKELASHLVERGARTVVALTGPNAALPARPTSPTAAGPRYQPLIEVFGDGFTSLYADEWEAGAGRAATEKLLAGGNVPDALFAASDRLAAGAMSACLRAGLKVPGDIAVAGFGNEDVSECLTPALTTVHWPLRELARRGVQMLVRTIDDADAEDPRQVLTTELVIREST